MKGDIMKLIKVKFANSHFDRVYYYRTQLNLIRGGVYNIVADNRTHYDNPITVIDDNVSTRELPVGVSIREITSAKVVSAPSKPTGGIENIYLNEDKGVLLFPQRGNSAVGDALGAVGNHLVDIDVVDHP